MAVPVTQPAVTERWCVALMSTPTEILSGCAYMNEPNDASVSASTQEAPPCHSPYGWVLPATGIRPTTRSGVSESSSKPILVSRALFSSAYSAGMSCRSWIGVTGSH